MKSGSKASICAARYARRCGLVGGDVHLDFVVMEDHHAIAARNGFHATGREFRQIARVLFLAEGGNARHHAAGVAAGGERFHQQPVGFIAAAVRGVIEGILCQQDAHGSAPAQAH